MSTTTRFLPAPSSGMLPAFARQAFMTLDTGDTHWTEALPRMAAAMLALAVWLIGARALEPLPAPNAARPESLVACVGDEIKGFLQGQIYGSVETPLDWSGRDFLCDGMPRPGEEGLRLVFARQLEDGTSRLMLVMGLPSVTMDAEAGEIPANVTLIDEPNGRFFGTGGTGRCWADIREQTTMRNSVRWLGGELYCAGALPELGGQGSITLSDIRFMGRVSNQSPAEAFSAPTP